MHNSRSDPTVLALHGLGGGAYFFSEFAERLQPDYRVVSIDLPVTRPDFSMETWVDDLGALAAERNGESVVLLGHSMGTILALKAWAAWPDEIRGMIFVGGLPQVLPHIRERLSDRVRALDGARDLIGWGKKVSPGVFSPSTFRDRPEIVAVVKTVGVPCLAITGEHDQYAPPEAVAAFLQQMPRRPHLDVIPDCGHLPFLEQPEAFAAAVKSFLRTC
jgi:3-oxoadipate enol-lactonase